MKQQQPTVTVRLCCFLLFCCCCNNLINCFECRRYHHRQAEINMQKRRGQQQYSDDNTSYNKLGKQKRLGKINKSLSSSLNLYNKSNVFVSPQRQHGIVAIQRGGQFVENHQMSTSRLNSNSRHSSDPEYDIILKNAQKSRLVTMLVLIVNIGIAVRTYGFTSISNVNIDPVASFLLHPVPKIDTMLLVLSLVSYTNPTTQFFNNLLAAILQSTILGALAFSVVFPIAFYATPLRFVPFLGRLFGGGSAVRTWFNWIRCILSVAVYCWSMVAVTELQDRLHEKLTNPWK